MEWGDLNLLQHGNAQSKAYKVGGVEERPTQNPDLNPTEYIWDEL